ncbi:hypothetical protein [Microbacterium sp. PA5]|uniref:hypothetical protein n=1 Tax=Microbacterium sp. PA5 TaxID=3416654 RepID=UPI003CF12938
MPKTVRSVRIELNSNAIANLLQSSQISSDLEARAERIAAAAGPGHEVRVTKNRDRAVAFVTTATVEAMQAEAENGTLTNAIDAGR